MTGLSELLSSLRVRILGAIFFIFFLAMGMVLYGVWSYQRSQLVDMTSRGAIQMSEIIVAGLRSSMLQNDKVESMRSIRKILQIADTARISIINDAGRTVMTSDPGLEGLVFDKMIHPSCTVCHVAGKDPVRTSSIIRGKGEKYLATVTPIKNEPSCYGCHDREKTNIAILLVETSFSQTTVMLGELAQRLVLTGIFAFFIGALLLNYIVTRFFTRPLEALQEGFKKVGKGDFSYWVDVNGGGEIGYMADSFNVMSRAIGRFVNEIREKTQEV
ncbi:MAG: HAMP domain-containing protein, partial [Desulfobulbaceae bacterium]|nr:HAMP domain-containing protein [Desulfobulbaceae bacterium]